MAFSGAVSSVNNVKNVKSCHRVKMHFHKKISFILPQSSWQIIAFTTLTVQWKIQKKLRFNVEMIFVVCEKKVSFLCQKESLKV